MEHHRRSSKPRVDETFDSCERDFTKLYILAFCDFLTIVSV